MLTNPTSVDFGGQGVGSTSQAQSVSLIAHCDGSIVPGVCTIPVVFTPSLATTGDFSQTTNCPPVISLITDGEAICGILVKFTPTALGSRTGTLSTGLGGPTVSLSGAGVASPGSGGSSTGANTPAAAAGKRCKKRKHSSSKKRKCKRHGKHHRAMGEQ